MTIIVVTFVAFAIAALLSFLLVVTNNVRFNNFRKHAFDSEGRFILGNRNLFNIYCYQTQPVEYGIRFTQSVEDTFKYLFKHSLHRSVNVMVIISYFLLWFIRNDYLETKFVIIFSVVLTLLVLYAFTFSVVLDRRFNYHTHGNRCFGFLGNTSWVWNLQAIRYIEILIFIFSATLIVYTLASIIGG